MFLLLPGMHFSMRCSFLVAAIAVAGRMVVVVVGAVVVVIFSLVVSLHVGAEVGVDLHGVLGCSISCTRALHDVLLVASVDTAVVVYVSATDVQFCRSFVLLSTVLWSCT